MKLADLLNSMEQQGVLAPLYKAGVVTLVAYAQREVYNTYQAFLASPHYTDRKSDAAAATAATCRVGLRTVYRALKNMSREV
jgi:hypothetical protein